MRPDLAGRLDGLFATVRGADVLPIIFSSIARLEASRLSSTAKVRNLDVGVALPVSSLAVAACRWTRST